MTSMSFKPIEITVDRRSELEERLDKAVAELLAPAKEMHQGLLVTRLSPAHFKIGLSDKVPYGTITERVCW